MAGKTGHRGFGYVRKLPSGKFQASYIGPDQVRHPAPSTFLAKTDAEGWLYAESRLIERDEWTSPADREAAKNTPEKSITVETYAESWLTQRKASRRLAPRTVAEYQRYLDRLILPELGKLKVKDVTPATIKAWLAGLDQDTPRMVFNTHTLLKSIFATAVDDEIIVRNPCREPLRRPRRDIAEPATLDELAKITLAMPERLRLMVELAAWCALRFGEVAELRRSDIVLNLDDDKIATSGTIKVRRAVQWVKDPRNPDKPAQKIVKAPKADSIRDVAIPPHLAPVMQAHLDNKAWTQWGKDGLLFPTQNGGQYRAETFTKSYWRDAREAAGRKDLRFHDLRHTGAMLAAASGATLAELMHRLGHSTVAAALAYQHAAQGSDARIAAELSKIADTAKATAEAEQEKATS